MRKDKVIWEGWTVQDFIDVLEPTIDLIMTDNSYMSRFKDREELKEYCMDNQPYYKKYIPGVVNYFSKKYNLK
jgi:hypothetical protein